MLACEMARPCAEDAWLQSTADAASTTGYYPIPDAVLPAAAAAADAAHARAAVVHPTGSLDAASAVRTLSGAPAEDATVDTAGTAATTAACTAAAATGGCCLKKDLSSHRDCMDTELNNNAPSF